MQMQIFFLHVLLNKPVIIYQADGEIKQTLDPLLSEGRPIVLV